MRNTNKRNLSALLALVLALLLALPAMAAGSAGLTIYHERENVRFDLYHVAVASDAGWQPTDDFAAYPVTLPDEDSPAADWRAAAETLAAYVAQDTPIPAASGRVASGSVQFGALEEGLYLAIGETVQQNDILHTPVPVLIQVRGNTVVTIKAEESVVMPEPVEYTVVKVWQGGESERPLSVTVQLLCDGQPDRTVTLNALNGWRYTWTSEQGPLWQVAEQDVSEGFTVSVEQDGLAFTVTNTWQEPHQPGQLDSTHVPNMSSTPGAQVSTLPQTSDALPLTALVVVLVLAAAAIVVLVVLRVRKNKQDGQQ